MPEFPYRVEVLDNQTMESLELWPGRFRTLKGARQAIESKRGMHPRIIRYLEPAETVSREPINLEPEWAVAPAVRGGNSF